MIIIWGTHKFKKIMAQTGPFTCTRCNNANYFQLVRIVSWFTLFWIPIFPFSFKYYHICPTCGMSQQLDKATAKAMAAAVAPLPVIETQL